MLDHRKIKEIILIKGFAIDCVVNYDFCFISLSLRILNFPIFFILNFGILYYIYVAIKLILAYLVHLR